MSLIILCLACSCSQTNNTLSKTPIDKEATSNIAELYNRLFLLSETGILLGHQDDPAYGHGWFGIDGKSDVKDMTGDYPAVTGLELGHIELGATHNLDSVNFNNMKEYVREASARGGIVTFSWHGDNPATGGSSWDCAQDTVVRSILVGGSNHAHYLLWLDRLADFFLCLKDDCGMPIPVIFRMYHEHTGDWFWWGSAQCTPDEYKQLWIMTQTYLRTAKNVHNLLYAYSSSNAQSEEHYLERYPGDEYVDVLGFDHYLKGQTPEDVAQYKTDFERNLRIVTAYAEKSGKLPIVGETGEESVWDATYFTGILYPILQQYRPAWVLFWRNAWEPDKPNHYYLPYPGHPAEADFKAFVETPLILMNQDVKL
ncbi:MAG: glycoside hydrolase family 26 protein [Dysgonamonadaceae bacterium]|jgi:mannan endo-1,4-beta-mannosidase|nr:glycoside hydrolase family 26 protein [Dysgonamonadaceae bacterium]